MPVPKVLVIAGSDSSGGAGLEADQKTLAAHGCFAMTATTALTAQNTLGVQDVHVTPPSFVEKQIRAVMEDGFLQGQAGLVKIGMLASTETISTVAKVLGEYREKSGQDLKIVLDPVMVSTSGHQLLPGDAVTNLREKLMSMTYILTPNIPEALLLLREAYPERETEFRSPTNLDDLKQLATQIQALGPKHVLLKGGHMPLNAQYQKAQSDADKLKTVDILYPSSSSATSHEVIESSYLTSPNTHGTGCSLASAITAQLALHPTSPLSSLVRSSVTYVSHGIRHSTTLQQSLLSRGTGPINHFHSLLPTLFPPGNFIPYLLSHPRIAPVWHAYTHHPFTTRLAAGTLPLPVFKNYMTQDYLYLTHFARTYALAAYKSSRIADITRACDIVQHIRREMQLHLSYCADFGLSQAAIEATPESLATTAYARYVLDVGNSGDLLGLYVALAPCLLGYGEVARRLWEDPASRREGNVYWRWVENYVAEDYGEAVVKGREVIEREAVRCGVTAGRERVEELVGIFGRATRLEVGFWEEGAHVPVGEGGGVGDEAGGGGGVLGEAREEGV